MQAQTTQIGIVSPVVKGEWDSTVTYNKLNIVTHNGVSFIAYGTVTGIVEPGVTAGWESYWMKLSTSPVPMGEWNSTTTYPYLAIVTLDGSSYIANEENYNKNPATSSSWQLIAEKGDDGGFSPTAKVEQTADGAVITITDKSGTTTATVTDGKDGENGTNGTDGKNGTDGVSPTVATQAITGGTKVTITDKDGAHAFNVMNGTNGTNGKDGTDGADGTDGITPTIGANGNWYLGNADTGKPSRGANGTNGTDGKSAYQIATENGYTGTETQWLASLHAADPKMLPLSQYATEAEAIAYMDSQADHNIIYVWNNKVYCYASKTVTQITGACLYGYRNSASSGIVAAAGKSMYVIPVSTFAAPLHVEDYKYPISDTPYIYGGTAIPTFNKALIQNDAWVGMSDAFDISAAQLQGCTYVVFAVTTATQPSDVSVTVNGTVIPLNVITSPSQIESAVGAGTTTVSGYINSGVIYTAIIASDSTQKYANERNSYMMPVPLKYCESHATYEAGTSYLTKYPYATMSEMFSALATANSGYITETVLGKDQSNTYDIKSYVLDAPTSLSSGQTSAVVSEKPVFIITSGLHGLEPDAVHTVYHFMQDVTEHYYENEQLQYLHDNVKFVIIPICNPWGYVNQNYYNSRDVDINKNFEYGYRTNGTEHTGTAADSEAETQHMKLVFDDYPKAIFHLECHGKYGVDTAFNKTIWFSLMQTLKSELIELNANKLNSQIGRRLYELGYSTNNSTGGYITYFGLNGRPKDYTGTKYGILSGTMEGTGCIYGESGYSVNTQKINCEALENFILDIMSSFNCEVKVSTLNA